MIWSADRPPCEATVLGSFVPERVLIEYEGPRMFISRDQGGRMLLAYQCDEDNDLWRYTVVPCSDRRLAQFTAGDLTIVQMLSQPWGWVADIRDGSTIESVWEVDPASLPDDYRPAPDVRLVSSREPDFSLRLLGAGFSHDHVPLSVIKQASEKTTSVIRGLVEHIGSRLEAGLTDKEARDFADLSVSGVLLASFQISLELPKPVPDDSATPITAPAAHRHLATELRRLLGKVIAWSVEPELAEREDVPDEEAVAILRAVEELSPSGRTPVQEVQLGGKLVVRSHQGGTVSLWKETRRRAKSSINTKLRDMGTEAQRAIRWPDLIQATGVITNVNTKQFTFFLSEIGPVYFLDRNLPTREEDWPYGDLIMFSFDTARWRGTVIESLDTSQRVTVFGKLTHQAEQPEGVILAYSVPQYRLVEVVEHSERKGLPAPQLGE